MKKIFSSLALACALSTPVLAADYVWIPFGGSEYALTLNDQAWTGAKAEAESVGGHLATISNSAENDFIAANFDSFSPWIGYTDAAVEGTFLWVDGSPNAYTNWSLGEPNNQGGDENYTEMREDGTWNDLNNTENTRFGVIERELETPVPEVQTYATLFGVALIATRAIHRRRAA